MNNFSPLIRQTQCSNEAFDIDIVVMLGNGVHSWPVMYMLVSMSTVYHGTMLCVYLLA